MSRLVCPSGGSSCSRCFCPLQSPSSPAPGPSSSAAYAPGPANSGSPSNGSSSGNSSSSSGGGSGSFGPDLNSGNYQTVLISAQYDPGTAALLGNVVGNLSNTIMAGTNLSVSYGAPVLPSTLRSWGAEVSGSAKAHTSPSLPCAWPPTSFAKQGRLSPEVLPSQGGVENMALQLCHFCTLSTLVSRCDTACRMPAMPED